MAWFRREKTQRRPNEKRLQMPEGIWRKCDGCKEVLYAKAIQDNGMACPRCDFHFAIAVDDRIELLFDAGSIEEIERNVYAVDPLKFKDQVAYRDRLKKYQEKTGRADAVVVLRAAITGQRVIACLMDFSFMGGSLGSVVGEKITRAAETALAERLPLIILSQSGGARMQEGALSLMQMAKVNAALARLDSAGLPFISILTNPTTGGVSASYAMVGDLIMAEPGALIGFAGPRVIQQTIGQQLPEGFQRSEFLLQHGMVDMVVPRREMRDRLGTVLEFFCGAAQDQPRRSEGLRIRSGVSEPVVPSLETSAPEPPPAGTARTDGPVAH